MINEAADSAPRGNQPHSHSTNDFLVVGIGASAGGIQALKDFFLRVPADSNIAYVVILHMSPDYESRLAEILQTASSVPVTQVQERVEVAPNHVYVIPPNRNLTMSDGHLDLNTRIGAEERRSPVDLFFRTLAETNEERAVSVVLSGTGANGSLGIKRIKECGGIAFAQDPNEAEYADMPQNAISTGMVDYVLPVGDIAARIFSYNKHRTIVKLPETEQVPRTAEQALLDIFAQLRVRTGHDFSNYKRATILRRIERRLGLRELTELTDYARYLRKDQNEIQLLMKDLLISVTNFFRDPAAIQALAVGVIPKLFERKERGEPVRVWIPGCATGEEAFTLTMLLCEHAANIGSEANIQIFATDLDDDAVRAARDGFYKDNEVTDIAPARLRRFFSPDGQGYRVKRELRELMLFAVHNVLKDPPFSRLDLVSCRNLLIYLNRTAQARVLEVLHFALKPGGYLFLGSAESIEGASDLYNLLDKEHNIFRSRPVAPRNLSIPEMTGSSLQSLQPIPAKTVEETRALERLSYADLHQRMLEEYAPPSVVVNEEYEIVHLSDGAGRYLEIVGGEPTYNLTKVIRPELRLELRAALYRAVHDRINVKAKGLRLDTGNGFETVNIIVRPVLKEEDSARGFILVLFEAMPDGEGQPQSQALVQADEPIARRLEEELLHSRAQLRATVEQYEIQQEEMRASNEELLAANEELRSSAEELETSKEELQSVNEELTTVNQELKIKIEELGLANNNFQNLMNSTNIATIFLDRSLNLRQFTPITTRIFNLIPADLGRPLMDITNKLKIDNLVQDSQLVLDKLQNIRQEVQTTDGRSYVMTLSPYRTSEDRIDGIVITLVDITERVEAEETIRRAGEELESKVKERTFELNAINETLHVEVAERKAAEEARSQLLNKVVTAQEVERRRLARDLHDQLGQQLTALRLQLESLQNSQNGDAVQKLKAIVDQLDIDVDFLVWELRPIALDELGLETALNNYVKQWSEYFNIPVEFHSRGIPEDGLGPDVESNLYRIAQEALNNCAKHSRCREAYIILERRGSDAVLIIEDNGIGFDPPSEKGYGMDMGLISMHERALLIGGTFEVESKPDEGTTVFVRVPLHREEGRPH
jgi:two-component system, chemotaxis family, CheB/CheR fusion protein